MPPKAYSLDAQVIPTALSEKKLPFCPEIDTSILYIAYKK